MELKGEKLSKQVKRLHERHKELFDTAAKFPENYEAYCALVAEERMQTAASMFRTYGMVGSYGRDPSHHRSVQVELESSNPNIRVKAETYYDEGRWTNAMNDTYIDLYPSMPVAVSLFSPQTNIAAISEGLGRVEFGRYQTGPQGKWEDGPKAVISGVAYSLENAEAEPLIEVIDAAVAHLYDLRIAKYRQLGEIVSGQLLLK